MHDAEVLIRSGKQLLRLRQTGGSLSLSSGDLRIAAVARISSVTVTVSTPEQGFECAVLMFAGEAVGVSFDIDPDDVPALRDEMPQLRVEVLTA